MRTLSLVTIAVLAATLAGCQTAAAPRETGEYSSVSALKDAFVEAGGACPEWAQTDAVELAYQSGDCSGDTVLTIYDDQGDLDEAVAYLTDAMKDLGGPTLLVGDLWMINTPEPAKYVEKLGGEVVTSE